MPCAAEFWTCILQAGILQSNAALTFVYRIVLLSRKPFNHSVGPKPVIQHHQTQQGDSFYTIVIWFWKGFLKFVKRGYRKGWIDKVNANEWMKKLRGMAHLLLQIRATLDTVTVPYHFLDIYDFFGKIELNLGFRFNFILAVHHSFT